MNEKQKAVCVFTGSNTGRRDSYRSAAVALGEQLLARGMSLVYGGGNVGLMGVIADTVLAGGGRAVGVIPEHLLKREVGHQSLSELHVVQTMHERKAMMAELADSFVAMPGGLGTLEEMFEVLTWSQLEIHNKPCGLLNVDGYYDPLLGFLDRQVAEGFVMQAHRDMILVEASAEALLERLANYEARPVVKRFDRI